MKKKLRFRFLAKDSDPINRIIPIELPEAKYKTGLYNISKKGEEYEKEVNSRLLLKALEIFEKNSNAFIGCSETRKEFGEKISIFLQPGPHNIESRINVVVGRIVVEVDEEIFKSYKDSIIVDLTIVSRFDKEGKSFFAAELLTHGLIRDFNAELDCSNEKLFDFLLIDLFAKKLEHASFKGIYKSYRCFEGNDDRFRGTIDVARHIKTNVGRNNGQIAYRYRENTLNNYLNILVVYTYQYLKKKYPSIVEIKIDKNRELNSLLCMLLNDTDFHSISLNKAIYMNIGEISHPFYSEYEDVRKICLAVFRNDGASIFGRNSEQINSFVYYLPDLWEDFLLGTIRPVVATLDNCIVTDQLKGTRFIEKKGNGEELKYLIPLRPDLIFRKNEKNFLILDAKMIPIWKRVALNDEYGGLEEIHKKTISSNIDECIRYMEVFNTDGTGVIFPVSSEIDIEKDEDEDLFEEVYLDENVHYERSISKWSSKKFYMVPLFVPNVTDKISYRQWKKAFEQSKQVFKKNIKKYVIEKQYPI